MPRTHVRTVLDSGSSYLSRVRVQLPTRGRERSHNNPSVRVATNPREKEKRRKKEKGRKKESERKEGRKIEVKKKERKRKGERKKARERKRK